MNIDQGEGSEEAAEPASPVPVSEDSLPSSGSDPVLDEPASTVPIIPRGPALGERVRAASADTAQAQAEEATFGMTDEQLARRAAHLEDDRQQRFRDAFEVIAICALYLTYFTLSVMALTWAVHLILPRELRWLEAEDLTHIQTLLTAGVLVGVAGNHFKKRLGDTPKNGQ